ncbi:segregation/condensation protein A [Metamycoplasma hyosynoviae]|uniref:segregation/condensation protein A n=2 Tax=Metamycoplasma hyosynoviae TaxID=29559 RepID=UPI0004613F73|nr:segregation/condensation protein A [Metamycoplasma hyosynoviae]KDE42009.1 aromatic-ring-hydroxylating dioxygenase [Metamycoplasma hyosynoviae]KDE42468.1 aromatic-ring-hydroxylating dioxygenase [Metamycoplasma hyosynoviae]KDE43082.1 aromatic-ring-hydroxylating dioxygenase [Metamycoplasma hyosynoviae]KDE44083.1 aromatic-ring-hydroxylating dioxygenase [Metamycoplasma hyosynoviae]KDE45023.1 aromatic-ring-hydroxylating dioxygenase [Metamycoplasma hyosynoviae]
MIIDNTKKDVKEISLEEQKKQKDKQKLEVKEKPKANEDNKTPNEQKVEDSKYNIRLSNFDGPLDLLVTLVKEKNLDIFEVDLAELSSQYLDIIKNLQANDFDIASEYLVMAATLLQLKARMLLQDPEVEEEVKKEKKRLLEQIAEYEKFKEISKTLKEHEEDRNNYYSKAPEDITEFIREMDESVLDGHANSSRLVVTLRKMFERTYAELIRNVVITTVAVSPEEQKKRIKALFKNRDEVPFNEIFNVPTMGHFVITLLAVLDLSRQQIVVMKQIEQDGIIQFTKGVEYVEQ